MSLISNHYDAVVTVLPHGANANAQPWVDAAAEIATLIGCKNINISCKVLDNGECLYNFDPVAFISIGKVLLLSPNIREANHTMLQLILFLNKLKALEIEADILFSYMPYSRHDDNAIGISNLQTLVKMLETCGAGKIYAIDLHTEASSNSFSKIYNIMPVNFIQHVIKQSAADVVISPDVGSYNRLKNNGLTGVKHYHFNKSREADGSVCVTLQENSSKLYKRSCILIDDVVYSCKTIESVVNTLVQRYGCEVSCFVSHYDITSSGIDRLNRLKLQGFYTTNSVTGHNPLLLKQKVKVISITEILKYFNSDS